MRWKLKSKSKIWDLRLINKYCFLPHKALNKEYRWLESVWIIQMYSGSGWCNVVFIPENLVDKVKMLLEENNREIYELINSIKDLK